MRITVCVQFNAPFKPVADITLPVLREYCQRHGYHLRVDEDAPVKRSIVWDRYAILVEEMEKEECDWIAHIDADVLITNLHIRLEEFLNGPVVISQCLKEDGGLALNDGLLLVKNDLSARLFMQHVFETEGGGKTQCGQDVLQWHFDLNPNNLWFHIERHKAINSFLYTEYGMPNTTIGHWTPGDFVLHLPGRTNERRVELFTEYSKHILR